MISETEGLVSVPLRLTHALLILLYFLTNTVRSFFQLDTTTKKIPYTKEKLLHASAKQLARDIRSKSISSYAVVTTFIIRQKQVNPIINAIVAERYRSALLEAKAVDDFLSNTKQAEAEIAENKPLLGVPITIKESCSVKAMSLVVGAKNRLGSIAEDHGGAVKRLVDAGAIILCVTNTAELCLSNETNNPVTGKSCNPYNWRYTCGGSSGGEGALISSGGSVIGIGSDISGSIRMPAAFCGIFGHKPSTGIVDLCGHVPYLKENIFQQMLSIGPICRYAEDLLLVTTIITGNNPILNLDNPVNLMNLKIHYMLDCGSFFGSMGVHKKIKQRIRDAVDHFSRVWNCDISDCKFEEVQYVNEAYTTLLLSMDGNQYNPKVNIPWQIIKNVFGKGDISIGRLFYALLKKDMFIMPNDVGRMKKFVAFLADKINIKLGANGVFFYPVFPTSAFRHGVSILTYSGMTYTSLANVCGLPATTIPVGFIENGLPIGIQVIAGQNQDRLCLSVAKELESVFGGWIPPY